MKTPDKLLVPSNYSRIIARELGLQERELRLLLRGTGLSSSILVPGDTTHISAAQQMRILENGLHLADTPAFGLHIGHRLQPASHGPMGYLVLSSHDVIGALRAYADFLPLRFPFSDVRITPEAEWLTCTLELKIEPSAEVRRVLQECFGLMLQSIVESVLGRELTEARIELKHPAPAYKSLYKDFFHTRVRFSRTESTFRIPAKLARMANISEHSDAYAVAQELCKTLLEQLPTARTSTADQVRRLILSGPLGTRTADDVAQAMYVTKRTLQRRLDQEGTSYREVIEKLNSELAARHLLDTNMTVEAVATLLGYYDTAAFRKAFRRWYGQSPGEYRRNL